jgi:alpha,alpha-trehalase
MDGVVTQTAGVHAEAWRQMFDEYLQARVLRGDASVPPFDISEDYRNHVDGRPRYDGVRAFLASRGITIPYGDPSDSIEAETICGLGNRKDSYFWDIVHRDGVKAFESTVALIQQMRMVGLKTGVFSASKNAEAILKAASVFELFDEKLDGVDAEALHLPGKPHPAMLLELTRRLGAGPLHTVVFEDAIAGVKAGRTGGFGLVVGVNRSTRPGILTGEGADFEVADLSEVALKA